MDEPQPAGAVEQVARGPALVAVLLPHLVLRVERDGVLDSEPVDCPLDRLALATERITGRVNADNAQPEIRVARVPRLHVGRGAQGVDPRVVPELDEDRVTA